MSRMNRQHVFLPGTVLAMLCTLVIAVPAMADQGQIPEQVSLISLKKDTRGGAGYWKGREDGWFWYKRLPTNDEEQADPKSIVKKLDSMQSADELRKEVQRLLDVATAKPTPANIEKYLYAQQYVMEKSTTFAETWRKVVWANADLDYSLRRPTNSIGLQTFNTNRQNEDKEWIGQLAQQGVGLYFFFDSNCQYCHAMVPVLKYFQEHYGMKVLAISVDGGPIDGFPEAKQDNGISSRLGVAEVPAFFLVRPQDNWVQPIGQGVLSVSEIIERINVLTRLDKRW